MPKSLTVNLQNRPLGEDIEVPGLGLIPNGSTVEVPDEVAAQYTENYGLELLENDKLEVLIADTPWKTASVAAPSEPEPVSEQVSPIDEGGEF